MVKFPTTKTNPRWFALINDSIVTTPSESIPAKLLKELADIAEEHELFRDFQSPNDTPILEPEVLDLREGNVFYTKELEECSERGIPEEPAKLALSVDDRFELSNKSVISRETLALLFDLDNERHIFRDFESPNDVEIIPGEALDFRDGPTFYSRASEAVEIEIVVNTRPRTVTKRILSYDEVVALAYPNPDFDRKQFTITYKHGCEQKPEGSLVLGESVFVKEGMVFNVTPTDKS